MKENKSKGENYISKVRENSPQILSILWFFASVLLCVLFVAGFVSYAGMHVSIFTFLDFILSVGEISENSNLHFLVMFLLGGLYLFYLVRMFFCVIRGGLSFKCVWGKQFSSEAKSEAVLNLNQRFGKVLGMSVMYIIWASLASSAVKCEAEVTILVSVSIATFLLSGLVLNYAYEKANSPQYVLMDTLRNVLTVCVLMFLFPLLVSSSLEEFYEGVFSFSRLSSGESFMDFRSSIYVLFSKIVYPLFRTIVAIIYGCMFSRIVGNCFCFQEEVQDNKIVWAFQKISKTSVIYIVSFFVIGAICQGAISKNFIREIMGLFLPMFLLGVAGKLLFRFQMPEQFLRGSDQEEDSIEEEVVIEEEQKNC